jgi:hypothetical protein
MEENFRLREYMQISTTRSVKTFESQNAIVLFVLYPYGVSPKESIP